MDELQVTELLFERPRNKGAEEELLFEVEGELTNELINTISSNRSNGGLTPQQSIRAISHAHHNLAQLIVKGEEVADIAFLTGYSPSYIYKIQTDDPAFKELLAHYARAREEKFVDVMRRMADLGISALDELQARLMEAPEAWTKHELLELHRQMILEPLKAKGASQGNSSGNTNVALNVSFVSPKPPIVIDAQVLEPRDVK